MIGMNVFDADPFSATNMAASVRRIDFTPSFLSVLPGLIRPVPVRTDSVYIEQSSRGAAILPFSARGTPPHQTGGDLRNARAYKTLRFSDASRITSSELFGIRAEGSEDALKQVQVEVAARQGKVMSNMAKTKEFHILNLVTAAKVYDNDGTTVMFDWATELSLSIPAEVDFDLDNATPVAGVVRRKCAAVRRSIETALKTGSAIANQGVRIIGLCGDAYWDDLIAHPEIEKTYLNWSAAQDLAAIANPWRTYRYGTIDFVNYRGTDSDGTGGAIGVGTDKCKFFPVGADIFHWAMAPGERFQDLGQLGQEFYSIIVRDKDRDMWADVEMYSYPLPFCTHPNALYQARRT